MGFMRSAQWRLYVVGGLVAAGACFLLPSGQTARLVALPALGLSSALAIAIGVRANRPRRPGMWYLFAAGVALSSAGDAVRQIYYPLVLDRRTPFPSPADPLVLGGYVAMVVGLLLAARSRAGGRDWGSLADAAIIGSSLGLLAWGFLIEPYLDNPTLPAVRQATSVAYPVMALVLVAAAAPLMFARGTRTPSFRLLGVGLLCLLVANALYYRFLLAGGYSPGDPLDLGWVLAYLSLGGAALHPSMGAISDPSPSANAATSRGGRFPLLGAAALGGTIALTATAITGDRGDVSAVGAGAGALFLWILLRVVSLVRVVESTSRTLAAKHAELAAAMEALARAEADRGRLLEKTMQAGEEERRRVAAELHDGPVQSLSAIQYRLERIMLRLERGNGEGAQGDLDQLDAALSTEIQGLRRLMSQLRPPVLDQRGLEAALRDRAEAISRNHGLSCSVESNLQGRLDSDLETILYRVAQEALTNVVKHSRAARADVALQTVNGWVELEVKDDGIGFSPQPATLGNDGQHFGLMAIRERVEMAGGTSEVRAHPGAGTLIRVRLPRTEGHR